ncbi:MAG: TfoX/Sxy family protein [Holophagaceae bacterium]|nr:TfoX/Sxy family protein [Holophagaceae bacterium]
MRWQGVNPVEDALRGRLDEALAELPYARRTLFGGPCFFAGATLFAFIWEEERLGLVFQDAGDAEALRTLPGVEPWFPDRSRGALPHAVLVPMALLEDREVLAHWIQRAHAQAITAPSKSPRR